MLKRFWHSKSQFLKLRWANRSVLFVVCLTLIGLVSSLPPTKAQPSPARLTPAEIDRLLPAPQVHALPATLAQWQAGQETRGQETRGQETRGQETRGQETRGQSPVAAADYFDQVQPTIAGYLVWSRFPVRVYVEPADGDSNRSPEWVTAVTDAVREWNPYLPLAIVDTPDTAEITVLRRTPPLQVDRSSNRQPEFRARSAETRFTLSVDRTVPDQPRLTHRMTIWLGIGQTPDYLRAAARHELGHALGIWGHSPTATDVMYFAQVRQSPPISDRDINTLKRVYQQPTRLGWAIP